MHYCRINIVYNACKSYINKVKVSFFMEKYKIVHLFQIRFTKIA